jgi:hypothetical protein
MSSPFQPIEPPAQLTRQDAEYLRLLAIFHYVYAAMTALFGCFPIFHLGFGILALSGVVPAQNPSEAQELRMIGGIFTALGSIAMFGMWTCGALFAWAGRRLAQRRSYTFCFIIACLLCMFMPLGTILGVFTILLLVQPRVKAVFDERTPKTAA